MATFATESVKSTSSFRVLIKIDSVDGSYSGRFSFDGFTPIGGTEYYDGRLLSAPKISINRDSTYFGILTYSSSSFTLVNNDGYFDTWPNSNIIGSSIKIYVGYENIDISEYVQLYTGFLERYNLDEDIVTVTIGDLKKRLGTYNTSDLKFVNAVQGIENILNTTYGTANNVYTTAWSIAKTLTATTATVFREHPAVDTVSKVIEDCAKSTMGFFTINGAGAYDFKIIDNTATSVTTIKKNDVMNKYSIDYNANKVLASLSVESPSWPVQKILTTSTTAFFPTGIFTNNTYIVPYGVGISSFGVYRSTDDGLNWSSTQITATISSILIPLGYDISTTPNIYIGTDNYIVSTQSIYKSTDYGSSWSLWTTVNPLYNFNCIKSTRSNALLFGGSIGISYSATSVIYRATAGSSVFSAVLTTSTYGNIRCIESTVPVDGIYPISYGSTTQTIIAASENPAYPSTGTVIYRSIDDGLTWATAMTIAYCEEIWSIKAITDAIWVMSANMVDSITNTHYANIYYSSDSGVTWSIIYTLRTEKRIASFKLASDGVLYAGTYPNDGLILRSKPDATSGMPGINWEYYYSVFKDTNNNDYNAVGVEELNINKTTGIIIFISNETHIKAGVSTTQSCIYRAKLDSTNNINIKTTYQASVYSSLKLDTTKYFNTILAYNSQASTLGTKLADYYKDPNGLFPVTVPMKYYSVTLGDNVDIEIWREKTSMLGTKKCEVMGISYDLLNATITMQLRIIS